MKKYLYSGALALAAILTLSACAKPKLDAKLSVNDIVYMSGSDLKLKEDVYKRQPIRTPFKPCISIAWII